MQGLHHDTLREGIRLLTERMNKTRLREVVKDIEREKSIQIQADKGKRKEDGRDATPKGDGGQD